MKQHTPSLFLAALRRDQREAYATYRTHREIIVDRLEKHLAADGFTLADVRPESTPKLRQSVFRFLVQHSHLSALWLAEILNVPAAMFTCWMEQDGTSPAAMAARERRKKLQRRESSNRLT